MKVQFEHSQGPPTPKVSGGLQQIGPPGRGGSQGQVLAATPNHSREESPWAGALDEYVQSFQGPRLGRGQVGYVYRPCAFGLLSPVAYRSQCPTLVAWPG